MTLAHLFISCVCMYIYIYMCVCVCFFIIEFHTHTHIDFTTVCNYMTNYVYIYAYSISYIIQIKLHRVLQISLFKHASKGWYKYDGQWWWLWLKWTESDSVFACRSEPRLLTSYAIIKNEEDKLAFVNVPCGNRMSSPSNPPSPARL